MTKKPKKQLNKFIRLTGVGLQMGITIYLAAQLGKWLDGKYPNENDIYTMLCILFGVAVSFYNLLKQVNKINQ